MSDRRLLLISTGGTISMTSGGAGQGITPTQSGEDLVLQVPQLAGVGRFDVVTWSTKPGASLRLADLLGIAEAIDDKLTADYAGAIVVQGTDTIEETAFVLDLLVRSSKPVVVTGAMRGASASGADGPANLLAAATVAAAKAAEGLGALVVLNDEVHTARDVRKSDTIRPDAFTSPNIGAIGRLVEGRFHLHGRIARMKTLARPVEMPNVPVAIIKIGLDDDGALLPALPGLGFQGVVIEAMGAGHVPSWLAPMIGELAQAMPVVLSTRVQAGPVLTATYAFEGSEMDLLARGVIPGGTLASIKARLLLQLLLAAGLRGQALKSAYLERSGAHADDV